MNLTVDQMDVLNFRLTEVSLELLGNNFYDIFGQKCETLGSLYRSKTGPTNNEFAADSDLVAALKIEDIFDVEEVPRKENLIVQNDNCDAEENSGISADESDEPGYSDNREQNRSTDLKITKIINDVEEGTVGRNQSSILFAVLKYLFCFGF